MGILLQLSQHTFQISLNEVLRSILGGQFKFLNQLYLHLRLGKKLFSNLMLHRINGVFHNDMVSRKIYPQKILFLR